MAVLPLSLFHAASKELGWREGCRTSQRGGSGAMVKDAGDMGLGKPGCNLEKRVSELPVQLSPSPSEDQRQLSGSGSEGYLSYCYLGAAMKRQKVSFAF